MFMKISLNRAFWANRCPCFRMVVHQQPLTDFVGVALFFGVPKPVKNRSHESLILLLQKNISLFLGITDVFRSRTPVDTHERTRTHAYHHITNTRWPTHTHTYTHTHTHVPPKKDFFCERSAVDFCCSNLPTGVWHYITIEQKLRHQTICAHARVIVYPPNHQPTQPSTYARTPPITIWRPGENCARAGWTEGYGQSACCNVYS